MYELFHFFMLNLVGYKARLSHNKADLNRTVQSICLFSCSAGNVVQCLERLCEPQHPLVLTEACPHTTLWSATSIKLDPNLDRFTERKK